jgi:hypothetical protein
MTSMLDWLGTLGEAELAELLRRRPDSMRMPEPRTLAELAARLESPYSLATAVRELTLPAVQMTEALVALGPGASRRDLVGLLAGDDAAAVDDHVRVLTDHGIAWPDGEGALAFPSGLDELYPTPLGLGRPLRAHVAEVPVDRLRRMLSTLGIRGLPTRRADVVLAFERALSDPTFVRGVVAAAPRPVGEELRAWALESSHDPTADDDAEFDDDDDNAEIYAGLHSGPRRVRPYNADAARIRSEAARWAMDRGIVFGLSWSYGWTMPSEVARALRGPGYRAPFDPAVPEGTVTDVDPDRLAERAAAAVSGFAELALALVDLIARSPIPTLKAGGVGGRELGRLSKEFGCTETDLRLAFALSGAAGLIDSIAGRVVLTEEAARWRDLAAADRLTTLLRRWWELPYVSGETRDDNGKVVPALTARTCTSCLRARHVVLRVLSDLGANVAAEPVALGRRAVWTRPYIHLNPEAPGGGVGDLLAIHLAEAETLGIVSGGALTPIGTALICDDPERLPAALATALPEASDTALFGPDLTAVVAGPSTAAVSRILDASADRESRGGATVWRFTPGSVRRALDEGHDPATLTAHLASIATGELPQPLQYLIADIGRQHGSLLVSAARSVIRGLDEALVAQVVGDRALRKLALRSLAPTVLCSEAADPEAVLASLRRAGYMPLPEGGPAGSQGHAGSLSGSAREEQLSEMRGRITDSPRSMGEVPGRRRKAGGGNTPLTAAALSARLLTAAPDDPPTESQTERDLGGVQALSSGEIRLLAHAIDNSASVGIDYVSQSGSLTSRVISAPVVFGESIVAWCELRQDERWFRLERIQAVYPAG